MLGHQHHDGDELGRGGGGGGHVLDGGYGGHPDDLGHDVIHDGYDDYPQNDYVGGGGGQWRSQSPGQYG